MSGSQTQRSLCDNCGSGQPFESVCPACFWRRGTPLERPYWIDEATWRLGVKYNWNYEALKKTKRKRKKK